ncbi:hypothetical protein HOLleu_09674 [Holothuria leucospilota]|uniref:Uncharacterized protein n=1 Tax=Holothuria leucospilota TaxID=206669 RepID=A0A9Q1CD58_HOLLE|nr:hypothetical protein HOLleu_09674 [Holothuria leucospilota]
MNGKKSFYNRVWRFIHVLCVVTNGKRLIYHVMQFACLHDHQTHINTSCNMKERETLQLWLEWLPFSPNIKKIMKTFKSNDYV